MNLMPTSEKRRPQMFQLVSDLLGYAACLAFVAALLVWSEIGQQLL